MLILIYMMMKNFIEIHTCICSFHGKILTFLAATE